MRSHCRMVLMVLAAFIIFGTMIESSHAAVTITGTAGPKYLVTSIPVVTKEDTVFKISFENKTSGTNLSLCAGTVADFQAGKCAIPLSSSGGPGFEFLTIIEGKIIQGKHIYVIRSAGTANSKFVLTIE